MKASVRTYGATKDRLGGEKWLEVDVPEKTSIRELMQILGIADDEIMAIMSDGRFIDRNEHINEGDRLQLLPFIGGG
ncbi:MoaD/ThiS family protein [Youngiibacter fragilis]|uniref:Sulfur carrier protein ThiS n=1 Tax=Youngiibacter fragilis 232.1 TaxID=994573 RepID=V7I623_9CLOT|nr:MoaD/ThiS family protein [Youngiibacter fragilis]ETA81660.1 sulfur carrier protein ThiS [Youngiibacter fragilis 232.1]